MTTLNDPEGTLLSEISQKDKGKIILSYLSGTKNNFLKKPQILWNRVMMIVRDRAWGGWEEGVTAAKVQNPATK